MTQTIHPERIHKLNDLSTSSDGDYVLYWMQQSQRAEDNPALEYAVQRANEIDLPVVATFALTVDYPEANLRHYRFMLEGLQDAAETLAERGIKLVVRIGNPPEIILEMAEKAALLVCDAGYLCHQRQWRQRVAEESDCSVVEVEGDVIVPVKTVSPKAEYAARTIRPKIQRCCDEFLKGAITEQVRKKSLDMPITGLDLSDPEKVEDELPSDSLVRPVSDYFIGGTRQARRIFSDFLENRFRQYSDNRNQPQTDDVSHMGKYLHFGQVSPGWLLRTAREHASSSDDQNLEAFTEELLVRRELAMNYVYYTPDYDKYASLPEWAQTTLAEHRSDARPFDYSIETLDQAETHDHYWNAAMLEMKHTGYMHNYMRMYWGKKILEWTEDPEEAFRRTLKLNNKYFLDGRDPVSFASVAWVFGRHDRPWQERSVFGKVRYMNSRGLERKCDIRAYVEKVHNRI